MRTNQLLIAVCTQNRKTMLKRCITEVEKAIHSLGRDYEARIAIIDNSAHQDMFETFVDLQQTSRAVLTYSSAPNPGLANARNKALDLRDCDEHLVFIDDDEWPDRNWLTELIAAAISYPESLIGGEVIPVLSDDTNPALKKSRKSNNGWVGSCGFGNVLIPSSILNSFPLRFDERYNHSGGEDTDFCIQLRNFGLGVRFSSEAVCYEEWLRSRVGIKSVLLAEFNKSSVLTNILFKHRTGRLNVILNSILKVIGSAFIIPELMLRRVSLIDLLKRFTQGLGGLYGLFGSLNSSYLKTRN
jgi:glycosyltransferase involved in cell wall biosynthesis